MWIWSLLLLTSCSLFFGGDKPASAKGSLYKINFQEKNWSQKKIDQDRSDYVFTNNEDGRILLSNSFCEQFQDQPLDVLATKTFNIVDDLKLDKQDYTTFENREAYRIEGKGKVDGVPVGLILLNTRRNNCYFDFVSITPLHQNKNIKSDFDTFLKAVSFK